MLRNLGLSIIAALAIILFLTEQNLHKIRVYKIFVCMDIHSEIQAVPFAQLSQMQPGEPSSAIRARVIAARKILEERFKNLKNSAIWRWLWR